MLQPTCAADGAWSFSPSVAPHTGAPALTVPMGFTGGGGFATHCRWVCSSQFQIISLDFQGLHLAAFCRVSNPRLMMLYSSCIGILQGFQQGCSFWHAPGMRPICSSSRLRTSSIPCDGGRRRCFNRRNSPGRRRNLKLMRHNLQSQAARIHLTDVTMIVCALPIERIQIVVQYLE